MAISFPDLICNCALVQLLRIVLLISVQAFVQSCRSNLYQCMEQKQRMSSNRKDIKGSNLYQCMEQKLDQIPVLIEPHAKQSVPVHGAEARPQQPPPRRAGSNLYQCMEQKEAVAVDSIVDAGSNLYPKKSTQHYKKKRGKLHASFLFPSIAQGKLIHPLFPADGIHQQCPIRGVLVGLHPLQTRRGGG